ncbi:MAG: hypothetical protein SNJ74_07455 [Fimbriimonadaceae bacterium]
MERVARILLAFGLFLIASGLVGWASTGFSDRGKTAILSGAVSGSIMIGWAFLVAKGPGALAVGARWGALAFTILFGGTFVWRGIVAWQSVAAGDPKLPVAALLSVMACASLAAVVLQLRAGRPRDESAA